RSAMRALNGVVYSVEEAFVELWRNRLVNTVSVVTIAVSLFILGIFATISTNLNLILTGWSNRVQITLYLKDTTGARERQETERLLGSMPEVDSFVYVSKDEAIKRFQGYVPELDALPDLLESNPLPASYEIQVAAEYRSPEQVHKLAQELSGKPGIEEVDYDLLWIERLTAIIDLVRALGVFIGAALIVASVFTIFNVIKLTVYGRQDEIGIMRLVGATPAYIRGPFLVEGMLQGGLGGAAALALLYLAHHLLIRRALASFRLLTSAEWLRFLSPEAWTAVILGGMVVGLIGSTLSVRRFLSNTV
ncbi:MAG: permease-like cell division protein FtsX, partial [Acidobacteriota bacterium]